MKLAGMIVGAMALMAPGTLAAAELVRLNIAVFETHTKNYRFESIFTGSAGELLRAHERKAELVLLNRTPPIRDQDIVNLQIDALRLNDGALANSGLNCQFTFDNKSDRTSEFYSLAGLCTRAWESGKRVQTSRLPIRRAMLSEAGYGNVWLLIYENTAQGIAIYADVDPA